MGNQPSVEGEPRRPPQKLSKPRVASTNNLLSPNTAATSSTPRFSNSYLVGPPSAPIPPFEAGSSTPIDTAAAAGEPTAEEPVYNEVEVQVKRKSGLFRSATLQSDSTSKRRSASWLPTSNTFDAIARPKSVVQRPDLAPLTPALGDQVTRRASHLDLPSQSPRAISSKSTNAASPRPDDISPDNFSVPAPRDSNPQTLEALTGRSQSDGPLYAPSRRRSAILTPGVATRAELSETSLSAKKSFRKSLPENSSRSRRGSHEPPPERPASILPSPPLGDTPIRLATPSENDYRQLGGMKFGSLRITNGVPSPGPEGGHPNAKKSISIDKSSLSRMEPATEIKQPKPVSPLMATFDDVPTSGPETSSEKGYSPFSVPTTGGLTVDSVTPATNSTTQTTPEEMEGMKSPDIQGTPTTLEDVRRSDSGSNSSSSRGRAELPPKTDSGHGSSLSLKSLFGSRKRSQRLKEAAKKQDDPLPTPLTERRPTLKQNEAYEPFTKKASHTSLKEQGTSAEPAAPVPKPEQPLRSSSVLSSFRSRQTRGAQGTEKPKHSRGSSVPEIVARHLSQDKPASPGEPNGSQQTKKLQKLSNAVKRRSLPNIIPGEEPLEKVPSMPSDAGEKVQEHTQNFNKVNKRFSLKFSAKEVARPVVVESKEVTELSVRRIDSSNTGDLVQPVSPQPGTISRPASTILRPSSTTGNRRSILRKPQPAPEESHDSGDEYDVPDYILGVEAQAASIASIRRSVGNSAFDAAFVPMTEDLTSDAVQRRPSRQSRSRPRTPEGRGPYPRLRSRSSAPDFLETVSEPASPGSISCYSQKKPKTPPPISIRTRGSKKGRRRSKSRPYPPQQHPPMPGQFGTEGVRGGLDSDLGQSLRSFPVSQLTRPLDPRNQLDFDLPHGRRPPARPLRQPHQEHRGPYPPAQRAPAFHRPSPRPMEHNIPPHGRVLHSYNSPAYKGVPVWS